MTSPVEEYSKIISDFIQCRITLHEFILVYLNKFKKETRPLGDRAFLVLDELFAVADSFTEDPYLRAENPTFYTDSLELRDAASQTLAALTEIP